MAEELTISALELEELLAVSGGADDNTDYIMHTVKKGENLTKIAKKYDTTWKKIYVLNRDIIKNPNHIEAGWVLRIPA